jgi:hypothetical protein
MDKVRRYFGCRGQLDYGFFCDQTYIYGSHACTSVKLNSLSNIMNKTLTILESSLPRGQPCGWKPILLYCRHRNVQWDYDQGVATSAHVAEVAAIRNGRRAIKRLCME